MTGVEDTPAIHVVALHVVPHVDPAGATTLNDEALVAGMTVGDEDACRHFVRRHQGAVFGLSLRVLGDPELAEEVAQSAFLRAWQHASTFDGRRGSVVAWLLTITRNLAIDELRRHRIDVVRLDDLDRPSTSSGPSDQVVVREDLRGVARTIDGLPPPQRRALLLATWHGRTAEQIADLEGIPLGTAKTRVRTALLRLRAAHPDPTRRSG